MNAKIKYALPVLAVVAALMFVVTTPYVLASPDDKIWKGTKHFKHKALQVDGFVGSIPVMEDSDKAALKELITVSLSEAAHGRDVYGGHIGIVTNENGDRFLAWNLISMDKDSGKAAITIHIIDAGNVQNTAQITKQLDHVWKMRSTAAEKQ